MWGADMKRLAIALSAFIGVTGTALAADMPVKAMPRATPVPYSWTGCFVGVAGGGTWGRSRHISGDLATFGLNITNDYDISGGIVGVEYGCNWQTGSLLLGTESDFLWTNLRGGVNNTPPLFNATSISNTREHWLSTSRVRVGLLASPQLLIFATGGIAAARVEALVDATAAAGGIASETATRWGWTGGGGVEYAFGNGWSAKADYLYVRLNDRAYFIPPPPGFAIRGNVPVQQHVVRVGVNYKFTSCLFLFTC
jgi:outer membrane immunogenic protein